MTIGECITELHNNCTEIRLYPLACSNANFLMVAGSSTPLQMMYDVDSVASSQLANISTRGFVGTGNDVMIGGYIVRGGASPVLVRALGPSLAQFGVINVLTDPTIELRDANGVLVAANDNWKQIQQTAIQATGLQPPNDAEAAISTRLPSGAFTAIVRGAHGGSGIALLE